MPAIDENFYKSFKLSLETFNKSVKKQLKNNKKEYFFVAWQLHIIDDPFKICSGAKILCYSHTRLEKKSIKFKINFTLLEKKNLLPNSTPYATIQTAHR